jgi:hypothetical protein
MPTTRTPITRFGKFKVTPEAVEIFRRMQEAEDREQAKQLLGELGDTMKLPPYCYPAVVDPDEACPYPKGHGIRDWWPEAQALWRILDRLAYPDEDAA